MIFLWWHILLLKNKKNCTESTNVLNFFKDRKDQKFKYPNLVFWEIWYFGFVF